MLGLSTVNEDLKLRINKKIVLLGLPLQWVFPKISKSKIKCAHAMSFCFSVELKKSGSLACLVNSWLFCYQCSRQNRFE